MKLTIEVEAPDHHVVPGLAAQLAPEVARLASAQLSGARFTVVSATEDGVEHPDFAVVDELDEDPDETGAANAEEPVSSDLLPASPLTLSADHPWAAWINAHLGQG